MLLPSSMISSSKWRVLRSIGIPGALNYIVDQALQYGLGARGLRSICESIITDAMFEMPSQTGIKELTISLEYAQEKFGKASTYHIRSVA